jgi:hypothetical protein
VNLLAKFERRRSFSERRFAFNQVFRRRRWGSPGDMMDQTPAGALGLDSLIKIKALIDADFLSKQVTKGYDGSPIWNINPVFEKQPSEPMRDGVS